MLIVFVDGVGVGPDDPAVNPLAGRLPAVEQIVGDRPVAVGHGPWPWAVDATLGVGGLPQSGTGQTALLTGVNAPGLVGRHVGPYPDAACRALLAGHSLWRRLADGGVQCALANAFPAPYLERVRLGTARMGAIARSAHEAGVRLRGADDLRAGAGVSAFLTNEAWRERFGPSDLPRIDETEAGARLAGLAAAGRLMLFEHFATDIAGHRETVDGARLALERLDRFLAGVLVALPVDVPLLLVSDHGNVEDMSTRRHTRNPALAAWHGPAAPSLAALTDVAGAVLSHFGVQPGAPPDVPGSPAAGGPSPR